MFAFYALERELEEEARKEDGPRPQADPLAKLLAEGSRENTPA